MAASARSYTDFYKDRENTPGARITKAPGDRMGVNDQLDDEEDPRRAAMKRRLKKLQSPKVAS